MGHDWGTTVGGDIAERAKLGGITYPSPMNDDELKADRSRAGLCADCIHAQRVHSARSSTFYLCKLSAADPKFRKYPQLPVIQCRGYAPQASQ